MSSIKEQYQIMFKEKCHSEKERKKKETHKMA